MRIEHISIESLSNHSYLVIDEATRQAVVIDPVRDVDIYLAAAARLDVRITGVLETHVHNDFLSGGPELAGRTGATLYASATSSLAIPHTPVGHGSAIDVGGLSLTALETPGHTPEHMAYQALPQGRQPSAVFTGGALLPGGVARTDLLGPDLAVSLTRQLHHSLHHHLLTLPDDTVVHPTHGGGSFCSTAQTGTTLTTIGEQRRTNHLLALATPEEFIEEVLRDLPPYPSYFDRMRPINLEGSRPLPMLPQLRPLAGEEVRALQNHAAIIDARSPDDFAAGHVKGAISVPADPNFASWVGWLFPLEQPLVLVLPGPDAAEPLVRQLVRIGFDTLHGYLAGTAREWPATELEVTTTHTVATEQLHRLWRSGDHVPIFDVRFPAEWKSGHIPGAVSLPLSVLAGQGVPEGIRGPVITTCGHGPRAMLAASILQRVGWSDVTAVIGGSVEWEQRGYPMEREG